MTWLVFAFSGPVLWAISVHLDKYLIDRYFKQAGVGVMLVFTAALGSLMLPFIYSLDPKVADVSIEAASALIASGLLYMGAIFFYLQALQSEEASVVAPFFQAAPLFGFALGYLVLGERLSSSQMAGGLLIIGGAVVLSWQPGGHGFRFNLRLITWMLACALASSIGSLIFKIFAVSDDFWTATFWSLVGQGLYGAALICLRSTRRRLHQLLLGAARGRMIAIGLTNEMVNLGGSLGARYALELAPLSLVQAVGSTTSLFVFLFGTILSMAAPSLPAEDLRPGTLLRKGGAAFLIVIGVIIANHR